MAQSYDRRINLYINIDGKDVKNNAASIRAEMNKIVNEQARMTIGSAEYNKQADKIKNLKGIMAQHRDNITETKSAWSGLMEKAKGLLPAFSFAAVGAAATYVFGKITSATHALADKWEFAMAGMNNGLDHFWKTMATGDWSNFFVNLNEAVKVGYEYASMLDKVDDQTRALSMIESDARAEELRLEEALKNKLLSTKDRIKAGQDRIELEKTLSKDRVKITDETFDAEVLIASQQSKLSQEQLIAVAKDIDSKKKLDAEAYNDKVDHLNALKKLNISTVVTPYGGTSSMPKPDTAEITKLKKELDSTPEAVKAYADALNRYDILTVEQQKKFVAAYVARNAAENSAPENLKKVITGVNSLLAGQEDNGTKIEDRVAKGKKEAADKAIEIFDAANNERTSRIITQYETEGWTDARFKAEMLAAEQAYLLQKKALLINNGQSTVDIDAQINQKRIEQQKDLNSALAESEKEYSDLQNKTQETEDEAIIANIDATNKVYDNLKAQKDKEKQILEEREQAYLSFAMSIGSSMGQLMNDQEASFDDYLKAILVMSLDALHQFYLLKLAEVWIDAAAGAATGRFWKIAGAIVAVGAMEAAYQGVRGALTAKKEKSGTKGYASGGFTDGERIYMAGEDGPEWISPNWMLKNPISAPIIAGLESWRRNPVTLSSGAIATTETYRTSSFSPNSSSPQTIQKNFSQPESSKVDIENLNKAINLNTQASAMLLKDGVRIDIVTIKRKMKIYEDIVENSGLRGFTKK